MIDLFYIHTFELNAIPMINESIRFQSLTQPPGMSGKDDDGGQNAFDIVRYDNYSR